VQKALRAIDFRNVQELPKNNQKFDGSVFCCKLAILDAPRSIVEMSQQWLHWLAELIGQKFTLQVIENTRGGQCYKHRKKFASLTCADSFIWQSFSVLFKENYNILRPMNWFISIRVFVAWATCLKSRLPWQCGFCEWTFMYYIKILLSLLRHTIWANQHQRTGTLL
jgi:hypothetical protein